MKIVETVSGSVTSTKQFYGGEERDGSGNVTKQVFAEGILDNGTNFFYCRDHLGSTRALTDDNGDVQASYSFNPFGRQTKLEGPQDSDFGFAGMYYHARSGLSLTVFRAYNASLGIWISRDPSGESGGLNLYNYGFSSPTNLTDPLGLEPQIFMAWHPVSMTPGYHGNIVVIDGQDVTVYRGEVKGGDPVFHTNAPLKLAVSHFTGGSAAYDKFFPGRHGPFQPVSTRPGYTSTDVAGNLSKIAAAISGSTWLYYYRRTNSNALAASLLIKAGAKLPTPAPGAMLVPGWGTRLDLSSTNKACAPRNPFVPYATLNGAALYQMIYLGVDYSGRSEGDSSNLNISSPDPNVVRQLRP